MDSTTTQNATSSDDRMAHHLRALTEEAEALLKATARAGDAKVEHARERLRDELTQLRDRLLDLEDLAGTRIRHAARRTDEVVHEHPYSAMGTAAAIGLLLGFVLGRR